MVTAPLQEYLFLSHFSTLSELKFSNLLACYGDLNSVLNASSQELISRGVNPGLLGQLRNARHLASSNRDVQKALEWNEREGNSIVCFEDSCYPQRLKEIDHAPALLYVKGKVDLLKKAQLAIVGSRKASPYGLNNAFQLAKDSAAAGLTVTSGLATGIDSRAHQGALDQGGGTIAVIGTGIDRCYPTKNHSLKQKIESCGTVISEFCLGSPPLAHHFPRRNRIISGLSIGVLVIEAANRSGSLISARLAMEQNREVFAVPGLISNPQSEGCHRLIREGAKLVESVVDIIEEFPFLETKATEAQGRQAESKEMLSQESPNIQTRKLSAIDSALLSRDKNYLPNNLVNSKQEKILAVLKSQPSLLDTLAVETKIDQQELIEALFELEARGSITLESGRYNYCGG